MLVMNMLTEAEPTKSENGGAELKVRNDRKRFLV